MSLNPHSRGVALCVLSAVAFGAMAIFAKEAYAGGVTVVTLLSLRFLLAALMFWGVVLARGARLPERRVVVQGLLLGAFGYAAQGGCYFGALTRLDASLTSLLTYIYPILVFLGALALGREQSTPRRLGALGLATAGTLLVLAGGTVGAIDPLGVAPRARLRRRLRGLHLDLRPHGRGRRPVRPGRAGVLGRGGVDDDRRRRDRLAALRLRRGVWGWIALLTFGSTVVGISAFLVGMRDVGPATASIVSTAEPAVTVGLATTIYGEALGPTQVFGARAGAGRRRDPAAARSRWRIPLAAMSLPISPPLSPQLARSRTSLPEGDGWAYEPKFDGFRALVFVDGDEVVIKSRNGKPLDRYFPEVVASLPAGRYVLDGEIVAASFDTLGQRIHPAASRIERLTVETPARLIAFDLLALGDDALVDAALPRAPRRAREGRARRRRAGARRLDRRRRRAAGSTPRRA